MLGKCRVRFEGECQTVSDMVQFPGPAFSCSSEGSDSPRPYWGPGARGCLPGSALGALKGVAGGLYRGSIHFDCILPEHLAKFLSNYY